MKHEGLDLTERQCERDGCGEWFKPRRQHQVYHSPACKQAGYRERQDTEADELAGRVFDPAEEEANDPDEAKDEEWAPFFDDRFADPGDDERDRGLC